MAMDYDYLLADAFHNANDLQELESLLEQEVKTLEARRVKTNNTMVNLVAFRKILKTMQSEEFKAKEDQDKISTVLALLKKMLHVETVKAKNKQ